MGVKGLITCLVTLTMVSGWHLTAANFQHVIIGICNENKYVTFCFKETIRKGGRKRDKIVYFLNVWPAGFLGSQSHILHFWSQSQRDCLLHERSFLGYLLDQCLDQKDFHHHMGYRLEEIISTTKVSIFLYYI